MNPSPPKPSRILLPCPKHKRLPDVAVCSHCIAEMGEFSRVAEETLTEMLKVISELWDEGMLYFQALQEIVAGLSCTCYVDAGGHEATCPVGVALNALSGHENRILHRTASGKLKELRKDLAASAKRSN